MNGMWNVWGMSTGASGSQWYEVQAIIPEDSSNGCNNRIAEEQLTLVTDRHTRQLDEPKYDGRWPLERRRMSAMEISLKYIWNSSGYIFLWCVTIIYSAEQWYATVEMQLMIVICVVIVIGRPSAKFMVSSPWQFTQFVLHKFCAKMKIELVQSLAQE